jgi:CelD/BcsL family acetyltransferase involved in cellulose biosynthesis
VVVLVTGELLEYLQHPMLIEATVAKVHVRVRPNLELTDLLSFRLQRRNGQYRLPVQPCPFHDSSSPAFSPAGKDSTTILNAGSIGRWVDSAD